MKKQWLVFLTLILCVPSLTAGVMDDLEEAQQDMLNDYNLISKWTSENLSEGIARASAGGTKMPASVCRILGFEFGLSFGAEMWDIDVDGFRKLQTDTIVTDASGGVDMPDKMLFPLGLIHAKVGLPGGFDLGAKYGQIDYDFDEGNSDFTAESKVYGAELRKHVFGRGELSGLLLPDISLNLNIDGCNGFVKKKEVYTKSTAEVYDDNVYTQTIGSTTTWKTDWDAGQIGLDVVISKSMFIFTPFAGLGVAKNFGDVTTKISTVGSLTLDPEIGPNQTQAVSIIAKKKEKANDVYMRYSAGLEMNLTVFHIGLSYSGTKDSHAAYLNMRFQFR